MLVLACVLAGCLVCGLWLQAARAGLARQSAETAADLAALAAAGAVDHPTDESPCHVAERVATSNHATLDSCRIGPTADVDVVVSVARPVPARSRARAGAMTRDDPSTTPRRPLDDPAMTPR